MAVISPNVALGYAKKLGTSTSARSPVIAHASQRRPARRYERTNQTSAMMTTATATCIHRSASP